MLAVAEAAPPAADVIHVESPSAFVLAAVTGLVALL
jgi:hypothetical protein